MKMMRNFWVIVVVIILGLTVVKDQIIKTVVISQVKSIMGVQVDIGTLNIGIFRQGVRIKDLKVHNPPGFPNEVMVDIPEITVDYDLPSLLKGTLHLSLVVVDLKEMVIFRNAEGKLNVDALKVAQKKDPAAKEDKDKPQEKNKEIKIQMDVVTLKLGKVVVKDYSKDPNQPIIQAYDIGVDKTFKNIKSAEQLVTLVLVQAMGPTALKNAAIYGAASVLGVAFLPAGVAGVILGDDSGTAEFNLSTDKVYKAALEVLQKNGSVVKEDKENLWIKGKMNGADIKVDVIKKDRNKTTLQVTARKYMLPKPEIAEGVIYRITEALK